MSENNLVATVDRFENGFVVLAFDDRQFLTIAKRFLPKGVKEGDILQCDFLNDTMAKKNQAERAKHLLKEILNN